MKTICSAGQGQAGANTLIWNATSDRGLRVPNGVYIVEVTAKAEDGSRTRGLTRVRIAD